MNAQAPTILWNNLYPSTAPVEDHMSNMIMEDPYGGIVIVGNKRFPSQTNPYHEVLVIRLNKDGYPIWIKSFGGTKTVSVWNADTDGPYCNGPIPDRNYQLYRCFAEKLHLTNLQ